jgi:hypothetical protein
MTLCLFPQVLRPGRGLDGRRRTIADALARRAMNSVTGTPIAARPLPLPLWDRKAKAHQ